MNATATATAIATTTSRLICLAAVMMLVSCGSNESDIRPPAKLIDFEPSASLSQQWSVKTKAKQDKRFSRLSLAHNDGKLYAAGVDGHVMAIAADSGKTVWSRDIGQDISGAVGIGNGLVLVGTYEGQVFCLAAQTGELKWQAQASSEILSAPQTNGDVVVAVTSDGQVFAFDAQTGANRWRYDHPVPVLSLRTTAAPLVSSTQVFVAFDNGQLLSLSAADGASQWSTRVGQPKGISELERLVDIDATPMLVGGILYAASFQGAIMALSRAEGRVLWRNDISTYNDLAHARDAVYVTTDDSTVVAFKRGNGDILWQHDQLYRRDIGAPAALGDYLVTIDKHGYLHMLKQEDGSFAYRFEPPGKGFRSPPLVVRDTLYLLSNNGRLSAYHVADQ